MAMCCCPTATPSSLDGIEVVASATPSLPVTPTERRSDSGLYSSPKDRSSGSAKNLARYSMTEFSPMGRVKKPTAMTPEQREGQRERKVAMRQAVRDLIKDHEELSRTQRLKLKMAATAVRTTTKIEKRALFWDTPYYIILNTAVGGPWPKPPTASTIFPTYHIVDSVRVVQAPKA